ncbi:MAG: DUF1801 domain-containing protein [Anaerolineae bacterium]
MNASNAKYTSIDEYIATFPPDVQAVLSELRATIKAAAPDATEKISYGMPTFFLNGNLVHFGAHTHHIGFYPTPAGIEAFKDELAKYESSKGAVQFPLARPMPLKLITKIVKYRVAQNMEKAGGKPKTAK